jgi:hypothetical protein
VTKRASNRRTLEAAGSAAAAADAWIGVARREAAASASLGAGPHVATLLAYPRVRRRFPGFTSDMTTAFRSNPRLGDALASPDDLYALALKAGAGHCGGPMARMVGRGSVAALVGAIGEDAWSYGVASGGMIDAPIRDVETMIGEIQHSGCDAVYTYLEDVCRGLGRAACTAADLPFAANRPPQEQQALKSAVQSALEYVA